MLGAIMKIAHQEADLIAFETRQAGHTGFTECQEPIVLVEDLIECDGKGAPAGLPAPCSSLKRVSETMRLA